ncbi:MAG: CaiB/BaiF CoA transferase family protein [Rhodoglobus sp.]
MVIPARPLEGFLVADLTRVLAGPTATMMLADLGARVIKVERPGLGDDTRRFGPPWAGSSSSYFESANRSKQSIALDFGSEADAALARELTDRADIVVENYRTGSLNRFGLDEASVRARNPRVIYASITGFGSGEGAGELGYDFLVQAVGGLMSITGEQEGEPTKVGVAMIDLLAAKDTVMGILAAAVHRERTGEGQHIEVNLLSTALASLANQASAYLATGQVPQRMGNRHPSIAPYETVRCRDGYLALAVGNDRQWAALVSLIGQPELSDHPLFATNAARVENHAAMLTRLEVGLATDDVETWTVRLREVGVPAGKVNDIGEALALAEQLGLQPRIGLATGHPDQIRHPVRYSGFEPVHPTAPPALDQHGAEVRAWLAAPPETAQP